ncbi:MAG TPA: acyl-CoA dehydrogenase [Spirochaetota bacterium]|nr:acyl-CoA dehydrogenase [Spirochaetota bacterium]
MAEKFISERNIRFMLYDVLDAESLTKYDYFSEHSRETFEMVLVTAMKMATELLHPVFREMDKNPPVYENGTVKVNPAVRKFMRECGEGGWIAAPFSAEHGGQQIPNLVMGICRFIFSAANYSGSVYPLLTTGAAHLILSFGTHELIDTYTPKMFSGEWQGTMALTEPQAGSSLSDVATTAIPTDKGYYNIKGQKIFISAGEHDGADNVVHLMMARIQGAPAGVKGISLFVVPKLRAGDNGALVGNDVTCGGIDHKLGYRGSPICQLYMGENNDCRGFLVGEPHKGLSYMFQMMNEARIDVGLGATAIATAAYYEALEYTNERPQGRLITEKDPAKPQMPIIGHADVKRMLLFQRAVTEGSLGLIMYLAKLTDLSRVVGEEEKERCELILDLLTPVAKTYPSEMGILSTSSAIQCLGGYGYCQDFSVEQYFRDMRIHPIHEGTTGIQGMDLLGRKVIMKNGKAFALFLKETSGTISTAKKYGSLEKEARALEDALKTLQEITAHLTGFAMKGEIDRFLSDATLYLEMFGIIAVGWQWLVQALAAETKLQSGASSKEGVFYKGKLTVFRYFFEYELPKIEGLAKVLHNTSGITLGDPVDIFAD